MKRRLKLPMKKISPYFFVTLILAVIILNLVLINKTREPCDTVQTLLTSVKVKSSGGYKNIGFDLNQQNLTFGTLSPGAVSERAVSVRYTKNATLYVWAEGNFSSWIGISPQKLEIEPEQNKEIKFAAHVPTIVPEGEYNGKIVFCYLDREG